MSKKSLEGPAISPGISDSGKAMMVPRFWCLILMSSQCWDQSLTNHQLVSGDGRLFTFGVTQIWLRILVPSHTVWPWPGYQTSLSFRFLLVCEMDSFSTRLVIQVEFGNHPFSAELARTLIACHVSQFLLRVRGGRRGGARGGLDAQHLLVGVHVLK